MQLAVAKLRHAWPLLLIALFVLRRWWLRKFKKEFLDLQRSSRGGPSNRMAPRDGGPRRDAGPRGSRSAPRGALGSRNGPGAGRGREIDRPRDPPGGVMSPLWAATEKGDLDAVMQLLQTGCSTEQTYKGWTPLMKAAEEGHCEILKVLFEAKARVDATNSKGRSALSFAAAPSMGRQACIPALELMLNANADLNHKDVRGETARARAVRDGFHESVATIVRFVAARQRERVQAANEEQVTPE